MVPITRPVALKTISAFSPLGVTPRTILLPRLDVTDSAAVILYEPLLPARRIILSPTFASVGATADEPLC